MGSRKSRCKVWGVVPQSVPAIARTDLAQPSGRLGFRAENGYARIVPRCHHAVKHNVQPMGQRPGAAFDKRLGEG